MRVPNIHSCSPSPRLPSGCSRLCSGPAPKPSSEIEKPATRTFVMATPSHIGHLSDCRQRVRFGSLAAAAAKGDRVRFTPDNGHGDRRLARQLRAISGLMQCNMSTNERPPRGGLSKIRSGISLFGNGRYIPPIGLTYMTSMDDCGICRCGWFSKAFAAASCDSASTKEYKIISFLVSDTPLVVTRLVFPPASVLRIILA